MNTPPHLLELVELSNVRLFADTPRVDTPFPVPPPDAGQWIVLVGDNGSGKTTLLRALALALAHPAVANRLLDGSPPLLRGSGEGRVTVRLAEATLGIAIRRGARTEEIVPTSDLAAPRPWVVGYGVGRGDARGETDRVPSWGPTGELELLFDRPATLVRAVDWLHDLDRRVLNARRQNGGDGVHAVIWRAVERALHALLGITEIDPDYRHVMITHPVLGRVRLDALSDGYLSAAGWVIDLIARWVKRQEELEQAIGPDLLSEMTGIVLVDEIDLHLHPAWQPRIIDDVRRLFPRLSFVVTAQNPLTLHGARPGEIYVMRRDEQGRVELLQRDIQPGHDVDRVLAEQFGVLYTFDHETNKLLTQHRGMLQSGVAADDPARVQLERALATRLGRVGEVLTHERSR